MGLCGSIDKNKKHSKYHDREPYDTDHLKNKKLPKLQFHAVLANVKLKKYPYKVATPIFSIGQNKICTLGERKKQNQQTLKWMICQKYDFTMTEYELRKNFLKVQIQNEENEIVGSIIINLFLIATGPFHQDFSINYNNEKIGRVLFDLKLSQIIQLKIQSQLAQVILIKNHPGQEFSYSIKTIVTNILCQMGYNGSTSESDPSYPALVLLEKKSREVIPTSCDEIMELENISMKSIKTKKRISTKSVAKQIGMGENLMWNQKGGILPSLTTKVIASELHNIYFQILIWKHSTNNQDSQKQLFADCYVSFCKLFGTEAIIISSGIDQYESRKIQMTQKIEHYGKDYGKAKFQFRITNQPYFKQYQVCVHTEVGILKTSPIFGVLETKTSDDKCPQIKQILTKRQSVQKNVICLNKLQHQGSNEQIKTKKNEISDQLVDIFTILQKASVFVNEPFLFSYSSQKQLLKGQKILVQLGMKVTQYIQIQDPQINDRCWLILISLIKRGQFNLNHIGFDEKQKKQILTNQLDTYLQKKQKVAVMYKLFLYKLLELTLSSLNRKCSQYQRTFAEVFSAYAYFRIPEFRKEILGLITNQSDPEIIQWKGIQFNLHEDLSQRKIKGNTNIFGQIFDWQQHFYKCILKDQQVENQNVSIQDILCQLSWRQRFSKRGLAFFYFLKYWVIYVENNLNQKKDIPWRQFPGYNRLLTGFFAQMKIRNILDYPDALIETGLKLLTNEKLINPFMKILLNKTNLYDTSAVIRVLQYLVLIFKYLKTNNKPLPISFNYSYLFKGLKIIFQSQFSLGISSAITFIYIHFNLFHKQFRKSISMYFLGKIFWKLFLNWSFTVRNVFYHLIFYKIKGEAHYQSDNSKVQKLSHKDILARFDQLVKTMNKQFQNYKNKNNLLYKDKANIPLYKRMKDNIQHKLNLNQLSDKSLNFESIQLSQKKLFREYDSRQAEYTVQTQARSKENINISPAKRLQRSYSSQIIINPKINYKEYNQRASICDFHGTILPNLHDMNNNSILIQRIIPQKQFVFPELSKENLKYIPVCMPKFEEIQKRFKECLQKQDRSCPQIRYQISIDNRQIRPDKIDDW